MRVVLDACVLYPTVMREVLLGVASAGMFDPVWSDRLLEEWARAAARHGAGEDAVARGEIALVRAAWPRAAVSARPSDLNRLWLPDENDIHVLGTAIAASADGIVTLNAQDFPRGTLTSEGVARFDPDGFLFGLYHDDPVSVAGVVETVRRKAEALSGAEWTARGLMKKARLPRLGKAVEAGSV